MTVRYNTRRAKAKATANKERVEDFDCAVGVEAATQSGLVEVC